MADLPRIAIVGSGPSGFYAAEALLRNGAEPRVEVHMFERLPVPYGLVRYGVAPDHAKIRLVAKRYAKTAARKRFHFWGNVSVGNDLPLADLRASFHAVLLSYGAASDRRLGIAGENLPGVFSSTAFCAWYNGHPQYAGMDFGLDSEVVAVIGMGNVAMDVCRVLVTPAGAFDSTDMAQPAREALAASRVREVHCYGRRGPLQASFTPKELGELGELPDCEVVVDPRHLEISAEEALEIKEHPTSPAARNLERLQEFAARDWGKCSRKVVLHFYRNPVEFLGEGRLGSLRVEETKLVPRDGWVAAEGTGNFEDLDCGLAFRAIGYKGVGLPGLPFDERRGVVPHEEGRIEPGLYAAGWIKRGPSGLIGSNKKDSEETVTSLLADLPSLNSPTGTLEALHAALTFRGVRVINFEDAMRIEAAELARGAALGKERENFVDVPSMLAALDEPA